MSEDPRPPDITKFPDPHRYGTNIPGRVPQFKTHSSLRSAKGALASSANNRMLRMHAYVYEFDFEAGMWKEVAHFSPGDVLDQHPWYSIKQKASRAIIGPSDSAVEKAIASIVGGS